MAPRLGHNRSPVGRARHPPLRPPGEQAAVAPPHRRRPWLAGPPPHRERRPWHPVAVTAAAAHSVQGGKGWILGVSCRGPRRPGEPASLHPRHQVRPPHRCPLHRRRPLPPAAHTAVVAPRDTGRGRHRHRRCLRTQAVAGCSSGHRRHRCCRRHRRCRRRRRRTDHPRAHSGHHRHDPPPGGERAAATAVGHPPPLTRAGHRTGQGEAPVAAE
ncbi:hypothetical protein I4F81_007154 [Pyropia yezoensis]|uniref:Uncharacterized protein n=1 Tax=Pyropia yezoensis TaxID=2788 RepID=A0ACC3C3R9_PYRYE|nr:hypothetical protein I4F81_007154 [Neopyropia yezoensis]